MLGSESGKSAKPKIARFGWNLGIILILIALVLPWIGLLLGYPGVIMVCFRASGVILTIGYWVWLQREWRIYRKIPWAMVFLYLFALFCLTVLCPIFMSSASAAMKVQSPGRSR